MTSKIRFYLNDIVGYENSYIVFPTKQMEYRYCCHYDNFASHRNRFWLLRKKG